MHMQTVTLPPLGRPLGAKARVAGDPPGAPGAVSPPPLAPFVSTLRYHGIKPPPRIPWLAVLLSAAMHAGLILGFSHKTPPPKKVVVVEENTAMLVMPDLTEEKEKKVEDLTDEQPDMPTVVVPMLADVPLTNSEATFIQPLEYVIPLTVDPNAGKMMAIPTNIQHGRQDDGGLKNLFNIADLDRQPEPITQVPPEFPYEMKQSVTSARVMVGFIITAKGDVLNPFIEHSTSRGFEESTLRAVKKWKFRPGVKGGRKVNTRVVQPVDFRLDGDN